MIKKIFIIVFFLGSLASFSQKKKAKLNTYTFSEVEKLQLQKPKPIVVFLYTDWCKFCFGMEQTTFKNDTIIQLLNKNFYFIKLNGEEKKKITFLGKTFVYKPTGTNTGVHELAAELASSNNKISYPTTTLLSINYTIDVQLNSYIKSNLMEQILSEYINKV